MEKGFVNWKSVSNPHTVALGGPPAALPQVPLPVSWSRATEGECLGPTGPKTRDEKAVPLSWCLSRE